MVDFCMFQEILSHFRLAKFRFHLRPLEPLHLPLYPGSTLRGGFGRVLKETVCMNLGQDCRKCLLNGKCAYSYIFESVRSSDTKFSYNLSEYPHPFILDPRTEGKQTYRQDEEILFDLTLVGKSADYLPYFVFVYQELGRRGIGRVKGRYRLEKVESLLDGRQAVYLDGADAVLGSFAIKSFGDIQGQTGSAGQVSLEFVTPTRVRLNGRLVGEIDFHTLLKNLLRRLTLLFELYCDGKCNVDYRWLIEESREVRTVQSRLEWRDWERYSSRQRTRMKLGGFVGTVTYEGNLGVFLPLLKVGEYLHVGKGTSFGLGKYRII